jgi:protein tyrosine phosphatase (PTP) superfamily phosphohydrolase (DUF442 family)
MRIKLRLGHALIAIAAVTPGAFAAEAHSQNQTIQAPNVVAISPRLVTSGQPTAESLTHLAEQGFKAVIYLAPPTVSDAIPNERDIVLRQGLEFVNIPIAFGEPTEADFEQFVEAMNRFRDRKVLVHCQVNMRASSMTFLYRVIVGLERPEQAFESVARVWSPGGPWKRLLISQLRKAQIAFEPY